MFLFSPLVPKPSERILSDVARFITSTASPKQTQLAATEAPKQKILTAHLLRLTPRLQRRVPTWSRSGHRGRRRCCLGIIHIDLKLSKQRFADAGSGRSKKLESASPKVTNVVSRCRQDTQSMVANLIRLHRITATSKCREN